MQYLFDIAATNNDFGNIVRKTFSAKNVPIAVFNDRMEKQNLCDTYRGIPVNMYLSQKLRTFTNPIEAIKFHSLCYAGAYTEVFYTNVVKGDIVLIDINSLYPSLYQAQKAFNPDYFVNYTDIEQLGFTHIILDIPKVDFPCLPVRYRNNPVTFPYGTINGVFTNDEIMYAVNELGASIIEIKDGVHYAKSNDMFDEIDTLYKKRKDTSISEEQRRIIKHILVAGLGGLDTLGIHYEHILKGYEHLKASNSIPVTEYDENGHIWKVYCIRKDKDMRTGIFKYIAAQGRIKLIRDIMMLQTFGEPVYYCDTDCLVVNQSALQYFSISQNLGDYSIRYSGVEFEAYGAKRYRIVTKEGEEILTLAGLDKRKLQVRGNYGVTIDNGVRRVEKLRPLQHTRKGIEWNSAFEINEYAVYCESLRKI